MVIPRLGKTPKAGKSRAKETSKDSMVSAGFEGVK